MLDPKHTIRRTALALLLLTTGLSAQRYTGHDHAVFHRQPQPPPPPPKHQPSAAPVSGSSNRQKTATAASASSPQVPRNGATQGKLDSDLNRASGPEKTAPPLENTPRL